MCVSQTNNKLFLALMLGMFFASGCSGHSVKYGASSEGEGMVSGEKATTSSTGESYSLAQSPDGSTDGSTTYGGMVNSMYPNRESAGGTGTMNRNWSSEKDGADEASSDSRSGSDYGQQFGGVDGSGPNYGSVSGFGSGSAKATNPDPEAWANAYLRQKRSSPEFYGDSPANGENASSSSYGHDYPGVPESGPQHGAVDGFSQSSASRMDTNPEKWAQAFLNENGGPSPEYVDPEMDIAQGNGRDGSHAMGGSNSNGQLLDRRNTDVEFGGSVQDIYFAFDSWSISAEGEKYLQEDAKWLRSNPDKFLTIEGHCDQRGTQDYNLVLGKKRAEAARDFLINLGIQPHRLQIVSYGKERPFCQKNNEYCHQENRRNHMVIRTNQS